MREIAFPSPAFPHSFYYDIFLHKLDILLFAMLDFVFLSLSKIIVTVTGRLVNNNNAHLGLSSDDEEEGGDKGEVEGEAGQPGHTYPSRHARSSL